MIHYQCYTRSYQVNSPLVAPSNSTQTLLKQRFFAAENILDCGSGLWLVDFDPFSFVVFVCFLTDVAVIVDSSRNHSRYTGFELENESVTNKH